MSGILAFPGRLWRALTLRWRHRRALAGARAATARRLAAGPMRRVLVICYGNICRSAFVHVYLRERHADANLELRSAGFHAREGRETPAGHRALIREACGVDMSAHRSVRVSEADLAWADTIVLMDRANWEHLRQAGAAPEKLVWLGALDDGPLEIEDPYSLPEPAARSVFLRLSRCATRLVERARQPARERPADR
jgi:protein-tyrosine phosphatase